MTELVIAGIGAAASAGAAIDQNQQQKRGQRRQSREQQRARDMQSSQQRQNLMEQRRASRRQPNIAELMQNAQAGSSGIAQTMLTGPAGVSPDDLRLGGNSLLG